MPLVPFQVPPGIYRAGTEYQSLGRWYDASLVRFAYGTIQPVGGWSKVNSSSLAGRPCVLFAWRPNGASIGRYLFIGTEQTANVYDGASVIDITDGSFTTGNADATSTQGYGAGLYGAGTYGTPRSGQAGASPVDWWHADAWGENLVACYSADGRLLEWDLNPSNNFAAISNAPTNCRGLVVTEQRILMALGHGGDRRSIKWSDRENNTNWTPSSTSFAGDLPVATVGEIVTGERARGGILIHTTTDCHFVQYVGLPVVYSIEKVGDNCGIVSANAKVVASSFVVWMGPNGFFVYDGYVRPLPCDVHDYVYSRLNRAQISKVSAWHNGEWGEVWWFYPTNGVENDRYVVWNYRENHWAIGALSRTFGIDKGVWDSPICADSAGYWYAHEDGYTADGDDRGSDVFIESGPIELVPGERTVLLNQFIHDESESADLLQMTIKTKFAPEGAEYSDGPYVLSQSDGYTDVLAQGRQYKLRFEETSSGPWRIGNMRADIRTGSKR